MLLRLVIFVGNVVVVVVMISFSGSCNDVHLIILWLMYRVVFGTLSTVVDIL